MNCRMIMFISTLAACASAAQAVNYNWTNTVGGAWSTSGNWDQTGEPDDAGDTAALGDLSGPYTVTLGLSRTIGGITLSGSDPTLNLSGTITQSGGIGLYSGGTLTGTGTLQWTNSAAVTWSSATAPGGSLTFRVPVDAGPGSMPVLTNSSGAWGIASGQKLIMEGTYTTIQNTSEVFRVVGSLDNSGLIRIGSLPGPDTPAPNVTLQVDSGVLSNKSGGTIALYPRGGNPGNVHNPWSNRSVAGHLANEGQITVYTPLDPGNSTLMSTLGRTGAGVVNTGTITLDGSLLTSMVPSLRIDGLTFTNTGTIQLGGGRLELASSNTTFSGGAITGNGTIVLGRSTATVTNNWNPTQPTGAITFEVDDAAQVYLNRSATWDILSGQKLFFEFGGNFRETTLTVNQIINNNGTVQMGRPQPGDWYGVQRIFTPGAQFINNTNGVIQMYPRSPSNFGTGPGGFSWSRREIAAEVDNRGTMQIWSWDSAIGTAGANNLNSGTILFDSSITEANGKLATLIVTGASFTNQPTGLIAGKGILQMPGGVPLVNQGILAGEVTVNGSLTVGTGGFLSPGASAGTLTVTNGNLTMASGSVFDVELLSPSSYDVMKVFGGVTLSSPTLQIDLGYTPGPGDVFYILENDGSDPIAGTFLSGSTVETPPLPGNGRAYRAQVSYLAIAGSALTGGNDIALYNFVAVPEPSLLLLLGAGALLLGWRRRN